MPGIKKAAGAALFGYAVLYTLQAIFSGLYAGVFPPQQVWDVMNYCTAMGVLVSVAVVCAHKRSVGRSGDAPAGQYMAVQAAFYATLALPILYFPLWFSLLMGESASEAQNTGWLLVSFLNPLVLGSTGAFLWKSARRG